MKEKLHSEPNLLSLKSKALTLAMLLGAAVSVLFAGFTSFAADCEAIPEQLFRLHILANSDSDYDQSVKYALRDYLMSEFSETFSGCENADEAAKMAQENITAIETAANDYLSEIGCEYGVAAECTQMYFTSRNYGDFTVPAGFYKALRLKIGSGEGRNWWCVMFPPLCLSSFAEEKSDFLLINRSILKRPQPLYNRDESAKIEAGDVECRFALYDFLYSLLQ